MSRKHKTFCTSLNYIEHVLILASTFTECFSISAFVFLLGIPIVNTNSVIRLKLFAKTTETKKHKSIIGKKKKKHDKIVLLAKSKSNSIQVIISKALIDSNTIHGEFFLINNLLI